jgi:hypothetical protein
MKTTRYFENEILRKRPYIQREWCERALRNPLRRQVSQMVGFAFGFSFLNSPSICV